MRNPCNVLIVGASSSAGLAIVQRFLKAGHKIVATYNRNNCIPSDPNLLVASLDLSSESSINAFVMHLIPQVGSLHLAIFIPSILPGKSLAHYELEEVDTVMQINFSGQAKLLKKLLPFFAPRSQILMISSISAHRGSYDPIYAASKGAVLSFVKSLSTHLAPQIRVNAVAPGLIEGSTMFRAFSPEERETHRSETPMKQLLQPADLASVIYDLAQDHWSHLNGACIDLNGGRHVR